MNKLFRMLSLVLIGVMLMTLVPAPASADVHRSDMRGVWVSTIFNLDYPGTKNNEKAQKDEYRTMLDQLQAAGINTVMVQVRPKADAFYPSAINPWSESLTGTQGRDPGYDPLAFMVEETHRRGMSFHAWLNPYRVTTGTTDVTTLADNHPARLHPDWLITHNGALYYNPESEGVKKHVIDTVAEIVTNYDVDGIHFDDYFYPSNYPLPEGESRDGKIADARRTTVNDMVAQVYQTIKRIDSSVLFGISPMGIWKNKKSDPTGSATTGSEAYYSVFSDCRQWIKAGTIDYIVPQIYWEIGFPVADYQTLVSWWSRETHGSPVTLYIGQAAYRDGVAAQMGQQLNINQQYSNVKGSVFFRAKDIQNNRQGIANQLKTFYSQKEAEALPSTHRVMMGGRLLPLQAYNINGSNYFKLRDLATVLSDTSARFNTRWDPVTETIHLETGTAYLPVGGELASSAPITAKATMTTATLTLDGSLSYAGAFNILGNNYYKLRDIGSLTGFSVDWDPAESLITITP